MKTNAIIRYLLIGALLFHFQSETSAQYFSLGQSPASSKWQQVKSENFRVIFPSGFENQSLYVSRALETVYKPVTTSMGIYPRKTPVILHNQSTRSNAFAPYAPRRMEFYTTPPQDNYPQDWLDQLVLHEFRHVLQYRQVDRGFSHVLSWFFGEQITAGILGLFVPFWYIEGDATMVETAWSKSGRGRVPSFEMRIRAQFLERGIYNYDKATHGSYRDFTPNRYELGYQLVSYTRKVYGADAWDKALSYTARLPFMVVPFSHGLHHSTGYGKVKLYKRNTGELKALWKKQYDEITYTPFDGITRPRKYFTNYKNAAFLDDTTLIAERSSIDDITRIVTIHLGTGKEKVLFTPGTNYLDDNLSTDRTTITWSELTFDPRWALRDYTVIKYFDTREKKIRQLTSRSRYFVPVISPDGSRIACVEVTHENNYFLVILDAESGEVLNKVSAPGNLFFITPEWSPDNSRLVAVVLGEEGKSLVIASLESSTVETIMPFSFVEISKPIFYKHYILYTGAYSGIDNIYALDTITGLVYQVTSAPFGATDACLSLDDRTLIYSNYTAGGYELASSVLNDADWVPLNDVTDNSLKLYETIAEQENFLFRREDVPDENQEPKPYRKGLNLFNIHSWAPLSFNANNMSLNPGIMVLSQNLLSSSFLSAGYEYDLNEEAGKVYLNYSYAGQYPVLDLRMDYGLRRGSTTDSHDNPVNVKWHETNLKAHLSVPLNLTRNKYFKGVRPRIGSSFIFLKMDPESPVNFKKDRIVSMDYGIYAYNQIKRSARDLQPRWWQVLDLNFRNTPFDAESVSSIFSSEALLYFPGIGRHHGLRFYGAYQVQEGDYRFSDMVSYPRGFSNIEEDHIFSFKADYVMPLFYPDWRLGPIFYMKRIKTRLFYDYAVNPKTDSDRSYQSTGIDLTTDIHFFSLLIPFDTGVRAIYFPENASVSFQFLFSFNLSSF